MATNGDSEGTKAVVDIDEMAKSEMETVLGRVGYGHLGCVKDRRPYVVPIHYAYDAENIYIFTTRGMKTEFISSNPEVCLQVEEVKNARNWQSVVVTGRAELLIASEDCEKATRLIKAKNPSLTPAIARTWTDIWGRENIVAIYRIKPQTMSGRRTGRKSA